MAKMAIKLLDTRDNKMLDLQKLLFYIKDKKIYIYKT